MTNTQINRNYLIRYYPVSSIRGNWGGGRRGDRLMSANVARTEIGEPQFTHWLNRAIENTDDKTVCRSNGTELQFVAR